MSVANTAYARQTSATMVVVLVDSIGPWTTEHVSFTDIAFIVISDMVDFTWSAV